MKLVRLDGEIDLSGWRRAARWLAIEGVPPEDVEWRTAAGASLLAEEFDDEDHIAAEQFRVPRKFLTLAQGAILHSDASRFALLYRILWRLKHEPRLMQVASDADLVTARAMADAVAREIHKTHAFVRFREVAGEGGPAFIAWFEPTHHTLEAASPFFVRRFASMRWSILTPRVSAHWDGEGLQFGPGASRAEAPRDDQLEDLWRTYYGSIFNPARLKTHTMQAQMPRKYWRNMPEADLIAELIAQAPRATGGMIEQPASEPRLRAPAVVRSTPTASNPIEALRLASRTCTACPLYATATQTVFGEGPASASVMFVGEQPGDQEDLAGRPFVGPAGKLFDRALAQAGVDRADTYVTNAVKHFKFESRGKRRLHRTPGQMEVDACRQWLEQEIVTVQPRLIVTLGATAANSVLGRPTPVQRNRGKLIRVSDDTQVLVTVHPSYLLRIPAETHDAEFARFVEDLTAVARLQQAA